MIARLHRPLVRLFALVSVLGLPNRAVASDRVCVAELPRAIASVIQRPEFARSRFGVVVQTLKTRQTLYSHDGEQFFIPASNAKLFSTAAALQTLGSQYRIRTAVYGQQTPQGWILRVVGRGDPSLTVVELKKLAQQLRSRGIDRVAQLWLDGSYYRGDALNEDWAVGDVLASFGVPVNSLIVHRNTIRLELVPQKQGQPLRVDWKEEKSEAERWQIVNQSVTVDPKGAEYVQIYRDLTQPILRITGQLREGADPAEAEVGVLDPNEHFLRHLQQVLLDTGIKVARTGVKQDNELRSISTEVASLESAPLTELVKEANVQSDNLYADALLKVLGANSPNAAGESTLQKGLATLTGNLERMGVDKTGFLLVDGSGLARQNLITPLAIAQTLQAMAVQPTATQFRGSLAVAGVSGTLRSRFRNTPAQGIVQAKTGTLTGIAALSGYISPRNYSPLVFSVIVNQSTVDARPAIDEIVVMLAKLSTCE